MTPLKIEWRHLDVDGETVIDVMTLVKIYIIK